MCHFFPSSASSTKSIIRGAVCLCQWSLGHAFDSVLKTSITMQDTVEVLWWQWVMNWGVVWRWSGQNRNGLNTTFTFDIWVMTQLISTAFMIDVFTTLVFKCVISGITENGLFLLSALISKFHNSGLILVAAVVYEWSRDLFMDEITLVYQRTESLQLIEIHQS